MHFFIIKPTRCTNFTNLFWHETLYVLDSSSVHHQEFHAKINLQCICKLLSVFLPIYAALSVTIYLLWFTRANGIFSCCGVLGTLNHFCKAKANQLLHVHYKSHTSIHHVDSNKCQRWKDRISTIHSTL